MRSHRKVHVSLETLKEIPVIRSHRIGAQPLSKFKMLLIVILISVFIITITVPIASFKRTPKFTLSSSNIKVTTTTAKIYSLTTIYLTPGFNQSKTSTSTTVTLSTSPLSTIDSNIISSTVSITMSSQEISYAPEINSSTTSVNMTQEFSEIDIDNITSIKSTTETTTTTTTTIIPPNLVFNPGAEEQFDNWMQTTASHVIIDSNGKFNKGYYPHSGNFCFAGGDAKNGPEAKLVQRIPLLNGIQGFTKDQLDSGKFNVYLSFYYQTWKTGRTTHDIVKVDMTLRDDSPSNTIIGGIHTGELVCKTSIPEWCHYTSSTPLTPGTRIIYYTMIFYKHDLLNPGIDAYIDDNSLIIM